MRVLSNAPDPRFGGPLKRSLSVARELRPRGIETVFLVPTGDDRFLEQARKDGFDCLRLDQPRIRSPEHIRANLRFLTGFYGCVTAAETVIDEHDIDVVHANGPLNYPIAFAAARSDAALVWHFNDTLTPTPLKQLSAALARRWADQVVVAADAVGSYFLDGRANARTVYAPVDLTEFDPGNQEFTDWSLHEEFDIPDTVPVVGTIGNINPAKGHEYLIEAFAAVEGPAHLIVVGKRLDSQQEYYARLQSRLRELDIEARVTFTGWRSDIPRLLDAFDVFVLASVTEACPIVVLEAMAMQCPIVATDVGGVREQIPSSDHGWVVPPEDSQSLSEAIEAALTATDTDTRVTNARAHVEELFSLEACVTAHEEIYRSLAGSE